jgi:hypothetical protein
MEWSLTWESLILLFVLPPVLTLIHAALDWWRERHQGRSRPVDDC